MKNFLTVFILLGVWLMPSFAMALDRTEICYRYAGNREYLTKILVEYFTTDNQNTEEAYTYFLDKIEESLESSGVGSVTCHDLITVCFKARFSEEKCNAFRDELNQSWEKGSNKNEKETLRETNDPCAGRNERTIQTFCEMYNNTLKNAPAQRGTAYSLEYGAYGECYKKYGYELDHNGCRKKK